MSYGVQLKNANGDVYFNTDTIAWNFMGSFIAPANTSVNVTLPVIALVSETLVQRFFVDQAPGDQEAYAHTVSVNGTTVTASSSALAGKVRTLVVVLGR